MIGKTVLHYKIIDKIGEGGMGEVYLAQDTKLERKVAIKFLPQHLTKDKENVERFEREAKAAASLNHPNIVTIYEINEFEDPATAGRQIFIVMEYVDGQSLRYPISETRHPIDDVRAHCNVPMLPIDKIINIITQICQGLSKAHAAGIVHRDIKPENILVDKDGRIKILDFGLAKLKGVSKLTKETSTLGTVHYMSPEQIQGKEVDHRSDIWSMGVLFHEMLTGEAPFQGEYEQAVTYAILNEEPKKLENIPFELKHIVIKLLSKNPQERYQNSTSILEDLNSIKSYPDLEKSKTITTVKRTIRNKWVYHTAGILIFIVLLIMSKTIFFSAEESPYFNSIAVLPFKDESEKQGNENFCDGITEDIIADLTKINDLKVISRHSAMQYKNVEKGLAEIAEELNVNNVLEGSVRLSNDRIRIYVELIEAKEENSIWAENYDREIQDFFRIQSDVAEKIAEVLKVKLSPKEKFLIQKKSTDNFTAYNYYSKGREFYYRYQKDDNQKAIQMFKKALIIDPNYALAYAGLGDAYSQGYHRFGFARTWVDSAIEVSKKAIDLDQDCSEAYKALGTAYAVIDRSRKSLEAYDKSIELNPGYFPAVGNIGIRYREIGQLNDALKWGRKQIDINPVFNGGFISIGLAYTSLCEDSKAQHAFEKALELDPNDVYARWGLISLYLAQNKFEKALTKVDEIFSVVSDSLNAFTYAGYVEHIRSNLSQAYYFFDEALHRSQAKFFNNFHIVSLVHHAAIQWKKGEKEKARDKFMDFLAYAEKEIDNGSEAYEIRYTMAGIYSVIGELDKSFLQLDKAIDAGWREYRIGKIEPLFEELRKDKRFEERIERVKGLVDEAREKIKAENNF